MKKTNLVYKADIVRFMFTKFVKVGLGFILKAQIIGYGMNA